MSVAELDAALRAAMDEEFDGPPHEVHVGEKAVCVDLQPDSATLAVNDLAALDAALRRAMDDDWDGTSAQRAAPLLVPPGASAGLGPEGCAPPRAMGYLSLSHDAAAALVPGAAGMAAGCGAADDDDSRYNILLPLNDGSPFSIMPYPLDDAAWSDLQREQMQQIEQQVAKA